MTDKEKKALEEWKESSSENQEIFRNAEKVWQLIDLLNEMKRYSTSRAISKFHTKISNTSGKIKKGFLFYWQRVAAILLLPMMLAGAFYIF